MSDLISLIGSTEAETCPAPLAVGGDGVQGYKGRKGVSGEDGLNGFTFTSSSFVTGVNVEIPVEDDVFIAGTTILIEGAGTYYVSEVLDNVLTASSTGDEGNLPYNSVIPAGRLVTTGSIAGPDVVATEVRPYVLLAARSPAGSDMGSTEFGSQLSRRAMIELVDTHDKCTIWTNNTFVLQTGTWAIRATSGSFKQGGHRMRLTRLQWPSNLIGTDIWGSSQWDDPDLPAVYSRSTLFTVLQITSFGYLALVHEATASQPTNGFGVACNFGVPETYAYLEARMT